MSDHYFSQKPQSKSAPKQWSDQLRENSYSFNSDTGVFSKNEIDFGTRLLIESFKEPGVPGDMLDLGCGYGPIGIVLADCFPDRQIVMADINDRAIQLAQKNVIANGIENATVLRSDLFTSLKEQTFAAIISNPPIRAGKKIVHQIFEESKQQLRDSGELWIVIQKKQGAPSAKAKIASLFGNVDTVARSKGYHVFRAVK